MSEGSNHAAINWLGSRWCILTAAIVKHDFRHARHYDYLKVLLWDWVRAAFARTVAKVQTQT